MISIDAGKTLTPIIEECSDNNNPKLKLKEKKIPPFLGCLIADKFGKTLFSYELFNGSIDYFLKRNRENDKNKQDLDIHLIPMFISAFEAFSREINIQELSGFKLEGTNIKVQIIFSFDEYTIIFFLNPKVNLKLVENRVKNYFSHLFEVYRSDFNNIVKMGSANFILHLKLLGRIWLEHLNEQYISLNGIN